MSINLQAHRQHSPDRTGRSAGFTLLEVIVAVAVLAAIMVPLTTSLMEVVQETRRTSQRLDQSNDQQRITAAWTRDVLSLDKNGLKGDGPCSGAVTGNSGTDLVTFQWDQASVAANSGQAALVPKTATWAVMGVGEGMRLVRRYCEAGAAVSESVVASHFGVSGRSINNTIHGPGGPGVADFCDASSCTLKVSGSFSQTVKVTRRVSGAVAADATPPPPTISSVTPNNGFLTVTWAQPSSLPSGTPAITGYHVEAWTTATGGVAKSTDLNASSNAADVTGLTNGTDYWIVVYSKNVVGQGEPSAVFGPVKPSPLKPTQPRDVTVAPAALPSADSMIVAWNPPADDGGAAVDSYEVQATRNDGAVATPVSVSGGTTSAVMSGLSPDWTYSFRVRAHNSVGFGPLSDPANGVTRPPKPTSVVATAGPARAFVSFAIAGNGNVALASTDNVKIKALCVTPGGSCTDRSYTMSRGGTAPLSSNGSFGPLDTSAASGAVPLVVGQAYRFTVELKNSEGYWGPPSDPSDPIMPTGVPLTPTSIVSIASQGVSRNLHFTLASGLTNGGLPITSFNVKLMSGSTVLRNLPVPAGSAGEASFDWDGTYAGQSWTAFDDFTPYTFKVEACNANGCSPLSDALVATPGVRPASSMSVIQGSGPQQVVATTSGVSGAYSGTTWSFSCPGATSVPANGTTPTATLTSVTTGNQTCTGKGTNTLAAVDNGVATTTDLNQAPLMSGNVAVYGKPSPALTAPIVTPKATAAVTTATVAASNTPSPNGPTGSVEYQATCTPLGGGTSYPASTWGPSPRTVYVAAGAQYSCTLVAANNAAPTFTTDPSPATVWRAQRVVPTVTSFETAKAVPVISSGSNALTRRLYVQLVVRGDPGLTITGARWSLTGDTPTGAFASPTGVARVNTTVGNFTDYTILLPLPPSAGDWASIGSTTPRATTRNVKVQLQIVNEEILDVEEADYHVVPAWDGPGQDFPVVTDVTGSTAAGTGALTAGSNFTAAFKCEDPDTDGGSDDQCATAKIWLRHAITGERVQVGGTVAAGDGVAQSYTLQVPSGLTAKRWFIEAEFCNEDGACPSSPSPGYDGNHFQILGYFNV